MTIKQAIERLNFMIEQCKMTTRMCSNSCNDIEALRCAVRALESKPRWIPCSERMPEMHEENDYTGRREESGFVLICDASDMHPQVHVGRCWRIDGEAWWRTREWKLLDKVVAWMPLPEIYKED